MKVLLIKASQPSDFKDYKARRASPSQNIFSAAAELEDLAEIELVDETASMRVDFNSNADIVGIFFSTPDALRAYEIATKFKESGKTIFMGGLHASFMQDEALTYCSSVIIGECEGVIRDLLSDFENGTLKKIYQRETLLDLSELKPYPTNLVNPKDYNYCWTVQASRGCPYHCHFCVVHPFFGDIRYRKVDDIVNEIKQSGYDFFELHADNLTVNKEWAKELFHALIPLNIKWSAATDISIAEDEEFLDLAQKSGLVYILAGLETPSQEALKGNGKGFVKADEVKQRIKRLHKRGIIVDAAMMFGFDEHDKSIFKQSLDFALEVGIDICEPVIQIPFPGTKLFSKLESEGRILTYDWSRYDGSHAVYKLKNMSEDELYEGVDFFYREFNSITNSTKRKFRQLKYLGANAMYV